VEEDKVIQKKIRCPRRGDIEYLRVPEALKTVEEDLVIQNKIICPRRGEIEYFHVVLGVQLPNKEKLYLKDKMRKLFPRTILGAKSLN